MTLFRVISERVNGTVVTTSSASFFRSHKHLFLVLPPDRFHTPPPGSTRRPSLPVGVCCQYRMNFVKMGFGINELLKLPNLQAPIAVADDLKDHDYFAREIHPNCCR